jgi:hypothetical protein
MIGECRQVPFPTNSATRSRRFGSRERKKLGNLAERKQLAGASGTLTVGNGTPATTTNITLLGQYVTANFHIQNDGAGGTLVTDPPVSSTDPNQLALANIH